MELLISGANGFVGSNLIPYLGDKGDYRIVGLVRRRREARHLLEQGAARLITWQEAEPEQEFGTYIHLAGKAHDLGRVSREEQKRYFEVNVGLTKQLFDRFLGDPSAERFIFVSSVKAVADDPARPVDEETPADPETAYGISKLEAENYIRDHMPGDKEVWILRPCMIHGPGDEGNLRELYNFVARGLPWPLAAFENRRSYHSVYNFCYVVHQILEGRLEPGTWNLADSGTMSTNRLVTMMAHSAGLKPRLISFPRGIIRFGAAAGDYLRLPLNRVRLRKLAGDYVVSNRRLLEALGRDDLPVNLEQGMVRTLNTMN